MSSITGEIVAQGHQMKQLTLQFTGTIASDGRYDEIMGQGTTYICSGSILTVCNFKAPGWGLRPEKIRTLDDQFIDQVADA